MAGSRSPEPTASWYNCADIAYYYIILLYHIAMSAQLYDNALFGTMTSHYTAP